MKTFDIRRIFARRAMRSAALVTVAVAGAGTIAVRGPLLQQDGAPMTRILARSVPSTAMSGALESSVGWDLPNIDNALVDTWVARMSGAQKSTLAMYLSRMQQHDSMIVSKAEARGMPTDLRFLALIESGGLPTAQSPVKARGLWQFMSGTARQYGLTVNGRKDERIDPARSTDAALSYLSDLQNRFGSWYLAAAAYNAGEGRVSRVLKQVTGRTRGSDEDFYRIASLLPKETRNYVPKLIAVARIAKEPARYGITAADLAAGERELARLEARRVVEQAAAKRAASKRPAKRVASKRIASKRIAAKRGSSKRVVSKGTAGKRSASRATASKRVASKSSVRKRPLSSAKRKATTRKPVRRA